MDHEDDKLIPCSVCLLHSGFDERIKAVCKKIDERERLFDAQLRSHKEALSLARLELERRLEQMNQFRDQLTQQAATFISIKEFELRLEKSDDKSRSSLENIKETVRLLIDPIVQRLEEYERAELKEQGGLTWKNHIVTVLVAMAIFLLGHWILKF